MAGKKRSGLANDRRAYGCGRCYTPTPCGVINIGSIATNDGEGTYTLNGNYTITACQILNIPVGTTLLITGGKTLTNSGTINNSGYFYNYSGGGTVNNSSTFNNSGYLYNNTGGGGCIINNNTGGFIYTYGSGAIFNNPGGIINNNSGGFIYTYGGGNIFNDSGATINNNSGGTISTSNGGTCGAGTISGLGTFNGVIPTNTNCPPP